MLYLVVHNKMGAILTAVVDLRSTRRAARGAFLSDRQIAFSVREGRLVTATLTTGEHVSGYVMGTDDYHWAMVTVEAEVVLVHKSAPAVEISRHPSIERQSDEVKGLVSGFRQFVMETHFAPAPTTPPKA